MQLCMVILLLLQHHYNRCFALAGLSLLLVDFTGHFLVCLVSKVHSIGAARTAGSLVVAWILARPESIWSGTASGSGACHLVPNLIIAPAPANLHQRIGQCQFSSCCYSNSRQCLHMRSDCTWSPRPLSWHRSSSLEWEWCHGILNVRQWRFTAIACFRKHQHQMTNSSSWIPQDNITGNKLLQFIVICPGLIICQKFLKDD